ncbi:MAG: BON domain-containing protein, partial [Acidimicrobiia bacterium]|nr:BON domain-containing protein [Acidimicrobiia bacterium]
MTAYFGLLGSGQSPDSKRVGLAVEDDMLTATEAGGGTWNIPLRRVHLVGWAGDELRLELAGSEVSFVPEEPDAVLAQLVPALLARQQRGAAVAGPAGGTVLPSAPEPPMFTVDLTPGRRPPTRTPVEPAPPIAGRTDGGGLRSLTPPRSAAEVLAPGRSKQRWYWWFVAAAMVLGAVLATQLGASEDPAAAARRAIADGDLPAVAVAVENGTATLSGSVSSPGVAEAIVATVAAVGGIEAVNSILSVPTPTTIPSATPDPTPTSQVALAGAGLVDVEVEVRSGVAVLTGSVASEFERRTAVSAVMAVGGVDKVDNRLLVASLP